MEFEKVEHLKTIEQQYQVLSEIEHIRKRVGMYAGSPALEEHEEFVYSIENNKMELQTISYIPALIKIISEAIDNVVDEHNRNPKKINELKLSIKDDEIIIADNGGIPVQLHSEFGKYVPEIIFGTLRSGSNYSDEDAQSLIGTNGLGIKMCNVLSEYFIVETSDGSNYFHQEFKNGMSERSEPIISKTKHNSTILTFKPDLQYFGLKTFDEHHTLKIIRRLVDVAANNPLLKVYFNGQKFDISNFDDYISLYSESYVYDSTTDWKIGLSASSGFNQSSFVNSVETYMGGTHVSYVVNQITEKLRAYVKKKHKIDIKPSDIKSHLHVFISCKINRPKFSSQTKENMVSPISDFGTSWTCSDKFINKIITLEVVQSILDWAEAKETALKNAELRKLNKTVDKLNPARVEKFEDANEKKDRSRCTIFITEGDTIYEESLILAYRNEELTSIKIKDINVGDLVLTHHNRLRAVTGKSNKIIEGVKITYGCKELIISPEHRLLAYDKTSKKIIEVRGKNLDKNIHCLIKSRIVYVDHLEPIIAIVKENRGKYDYIIKLYDDEIECTESHKFYVWDSIKGEFKLMETKDIKPTIHLMVMKLS